MYLLFFVAHLLNIATGPPSGPPSCWGLVSCSCAWSFLAEEEALPEEEALSEDAPQPPPLGIQAPEHAGAHQSPPQMQLHHEQEPYEKEQMVLMKVDVMGLPENQQEPHRDQFLHGNLVSPAVLVPMHRPTAAPFDGLLCWPGTMSA